MADEWTDVRQVGHMETIVPIYAGRARYGGIYEGGSWLAWRGFHPEPPSGAWGDDLACGAFFDSEYGEMVGRGESPEEALDDLWKRLAAARETEHYGLGGV